MKIPVEWTCPHCHREHEWSWPSKDCGAGRVVLECEGCKSDVPTWFDRVPGGVVVIVNQGAIERPQKEK